MSQSSHQAPKRTRKSTYPSLTEENDECLFMNNSPEMVRLEEDGRKTSKRVRGQKDMKKEPENAEQNVILEQQCKSEVKMEESESEEEV